jgi:outer membrane protein
MTADRSASPRPRTGSHAVAGGRRRPRLLAATFTALLAAAPAHALDLREAYEAAQRYDAQLNSARLQLEAVRERLPQAQAGLKPSLGAAVGANVGRYDTDITPQRSFDNVQGALSFAFPLYRPGNAALVDQAEIGVRLAEAQLGLAAQDLVSRVAIAYFDVLAARDAVEVAEAQRRAISEQFEAAKRNFEVGTATITDQQEAQARLDLNDAQLAAARNDLTVNQAALTNLTGLPSEGLETLKLEVPLPAPDPADIETWTRLARDANYAVQQAELSRALARIDIDRARYDKRPVVDLVSQAAMLGGKTANSLATQVERTTQVSAGIQLSVPLYSGGALDARERETVAAFQRSESELENARRLSEQNARQAFLGLKSSAEQARALEAAARSSRLALDSNLLGYQVGVNVNVDVLNAQQQLFSALRDLSRARYDVLLNALRLRATAGTLQAADVIAIDDLLTPPAERMFPVMTPPSPTGEAQRSPGRSRAAPGGRQSPAVPGAQPGRRSMPR